MNRVIAAATVLLSFAAVVGCTPRSERWEKQIEEWPAEAEMGGTPTEYREYVDGEDNFEEMMAEENAMAEH